jgi:hypothetical protein
LEDVSDEEYFSEKFSNYISNSRLSLINPEQGGCPEDFFVTRPVQRSDSLRFGSAVHTLVLQPDEFLLVDSVDAPTAKAHYMAEYLFDVMKKKGTKDPTDEEIIEASNVIDYYKDKMTDKKINELRLKCNQYWLQRFLFEHDYTGSQTPVYLDVKSRDKLQSCLNNIEKDNNIQKLLHPEGLTQDPIIGNEKTILMDVKVDSPERTFVLKLKSKLDNFSLDLESSIITVNDLKTTGRPIIEFENAINKYHYHREIAMYSWLLTFCAKKFYNMENPTIRGNFLVVETIPEYLTGVVPMKMFKKGFEEFKHLLKLVAFYVLNGYESFGTDFQ